MPTSKPKVIESLGPDGMWLTVRAETLDEALRLAQEEAEDGDRVILTPPEEVRIVSIRAMPCARGECEITYRHVHYDTTKPGSRGSFRGAFIEVRPMDEDEIEARERGWLWGVGSDDDPDRHVWAYRSEEVARRIIEHYRQTEPGGGPRRLFHRADGNAPWREVEMITPPKEML